MMLRKKEFESIPPLNLVLFIVLSLTLGMCAPSDQIKQPKFRIIVW